MVNGILVNHLSGTPPEDHVNKGYPTELPLTPDPPYSNGEKAERVLGIQYIDKKQCALDTAASLIERFPVDVTAPVSGKI